MPSKFRDVSSILSLIVVASLIVGGLWFAIYGASWRSQSTNQSQPGGNAGASQVGASNQIIPCKFDSRGSQDPLVASTIEQYAFSEPKPIYGAPTSVMVQSWISNGDTILVTRVFPDRVGESIESLDVSSGKTLVLAESPTFSSSENPKPVWLAELSAVAFTEPSPDGKSYALRISGSIDNKTAPLKTDLMSPFFVAGLQGVRVIAADGITNLNAGDGKSSLAAAVDLTLLQDPTQSAVTLEKTVIRMAQTPDESVLALSSPRGVFLIATSDGQLCELDLGSTDIVRRWALQLQWSPNGRYLAMLDTLGEPVVPYVHLSVLDTNTGEIKQLLPEIPFAHALTWAPDSSALIVIGSQDPQMLQEAGLSGQEEMHLVDVNSGQARRILEKQPLLYAGSLGLDWSTDGQWLAYGCPSMAEDKSTLLESRVCVVQVTTK